jgi:hypothetical protein
MEPPPATPGRERDRILAKGNASMHWSASRSFRVRRLAMATALSTLVLSATVAAEVAPDRAEYVSRLESICKPGVEKTKRAVRGERSDAQADRLGVAAGKLRRAARIFGGTVRAISAVPRPPADAAQLAKWFGYLSRQESYLRKAASALGAKRAVQYQRFAVRFVHNGNLANDVVLAFGFDYCSFKFSRFG